MFPRICAALGMCWLAAPVAALAQAPSAQAQAAPWLWVTNSAGDDVHVFDLADFSLLRRIEVGLNPHGISATADGRTVHVALEKFRHETGELLWLDAATGAIEGRVEIGPLPNECECTPDGRWIYVACADEHYWVIDGQTRAVHARIPTGGRPHNVVASADGARMYLSPLGGPHAVTIVDVAAGHVVLGEIPFDNVVRPPAISADEKLFFQHIDGLLGFQVADIAARQVIRTVEHSIPPQFAEVASRCHGLGVRPDQQEIWSCDVEHHLVHVHETTSGEYRAVATVELPGRVYWLCFSPDSRWCFVSVRSEDKIAVVDTQTKEVIRYLSVGQEPKRTQVVAAPLTIGE